MTEQLNSEQLGLAFRVWSEVLNAAHETPSALPIEWKRIAYEAVGTYDQIVAKAGAESAYSALNALGRVSIGENNV